MKATRLKTSSPRARKRHSTARSFDRTASIDASRAWNGGCRFSYQGQDRFPTFQFDAEGKPLPLIKKVLEVLPPSRTPWQTAFWFVSSNIWLGGPAPQELLGDTAAVLEAAAHENDEISG